jgi:hypothetical protein
LARIGELGELSLARQPLAMLPHPLSTRHRYSASRRATDARLPSEHVTHHRDKLRVSIGKPALLQYFRYRFRYIRGFVTGFRYRLSIPDHQFSTGLAGNVASGNLTTGSTITLSNRVTLRSGEFSSPLSVVLCSLGFS